MRVELAAVSNSRRWLRIRACQAGPISIPPAIHPVAESPQRARARTCSASGLRCATCRRSDGSSSPGRTARRPPTAAGSGGATVMRSPSFSVKGAGPAVQKQGRPTHRHSAAYLLHSATILLFSNPLPLPTSKPKPQTQSAL